jgi:hypothetical protein
LCLAAANSEEALPPAVLEELKTIDHDRKYRQESLAGLGSALDRQQAKLEEEDAARRQVARSRGLVLGGEIQLQRSTAMRDGSATVTGSASVKMVSASAVMDSEEEMRLIRTGNKRIGQSAPDFHTTAAADNQGPNYLRSTKASVARLDVSRRRFAETTGSFGRTEEAKRKQQESRRSVSPKLEESRRVRFGGAKAFSPVSMGSRNLFEDESPDDTALAAAEEEERFDQELAKQLASTRSRPPRIPIEEEKANAAIEDRMNRPLKYLRNPRFEKDKGLRAKVRAKEIAEKRAVVESTSKSGDGFVSFGAGEGGLGWDNSIRSSTSSQDLAEEDWDGPLLDAGAPLETAPSVSFHGGALVDKDAERLAKTHTMRNVRAAVPVEAGTAARVGPFLASPPMVEFFEYSPGERREVVLTLRNADTLSRSLRVLPPETDHFSADPPVYASGSRDTGQSTGVLAPGMAVNVKISFQAESFAPVEDHIVVLTESGKFAIPLRALNEPSRLDLAMELDAGLCLQDDVACAEIEVTNTGSAGSFRLFLAKDWPPAVGTDPVVAATLAAPDACSELTGRANPRHAHLLCAYGEAPADLQSPPFSVSPTFLRLGKGGKAKLQLQFAPPIPGTYEQRVVLLSQFGDVTEHIFRGRCTPLLVGAVALDGVPLCDPELHPEATAWRLQRRREARAERVTGVPRAQIAHLAEAPSIKTSPVASPGRSRSGSRPGSAGVASAHLGPPTPPQDGSRPESAHVDPDMPPRSELEMVEALARQAIVAKIPPALDEVQRAERERAERRRMLQDRPPHQNPLSSGGLVSVPLRMRFPSLLVGQSGTRSVTVRNETPLAMPFEWVVKRYVSTPPSVSLVTEEADTVTEPASITSKRVSSNVTVLLQAPGVGGEGVPGAVGVAGRKLTLTSVAEASEKIHYDAITEAQFISAKGGKSGPSKLWTRATNNLDSSAPFAVHPQAGSIPAGTDMEFTVTFAPSSDVAFEAIAKLLIREIPADPMEVRNNHNPLEVRSKTKVGSTTILKATKCVTSLFLHAAGQAPEALLSPNVVVFPSGSLLPGASASQTVTLSNPSDVPVWFECQEPQVVRFSQDEGSWSPAPNHCEPDAPWHERALRALGLETLPSTPGLSGRRSMFSVGPSAGVIPPRGSASVTVIMDATEVGQFACQIPCQLFFSPGGAIEPVRPSNAKQVRELQVRAMAEVIAPTIRFSIPEVDFGLLKVNASATRVVKIQNMSACSAPFVCKQSLSDEDDLGCTLHFEPSFGTLPPFGETQVSATCVAGSEPHRIRTMLQCGVACPDVPESSRIRARGEIQAPLVHLDRHRVSMGVAFVGVPVKRVVRVTNLSNLTASFSWDTCVGMRPWAGAAVMADPSEEDDDDQGRTHEERAQRVHDKASRHAGKALEQLRADNAAVRGDKDESEDAGSKPMAVYEAHVEPEASGVLQEKETREFTFTITPRSSATSIDSMCALDVDGVPGPVGFELQGAVRPLTVAYSVLDERGSPDVDPVYEASRDKLADLVAANAGHLPPASSVPEELHPALPHASFVQALKRQSEAVAGDPGAAGDETMQQLHASLLRAEAAFARVGRMPRLHFGERHVTFTRRTLSLVVYNVSGVPTDFTVRVSRFPAYTGPISLGPAGLEIVEEDAKALAEQDPTGVAEMERKKCLRGALPSRMGDQGASPSRGRRDRGFLRLPFADEAVAGGTPGAPGSRARSVSPTSGRPRQWLGRELEDHSRFQSTEGRAELQHRRALEIQREQLALLNGVAFQVWPRRCHLAPFGSARVLVSCIADMPGTYEDSLVVVMDGTAEVKVPVRVNVVGSPLSVESTTAGMKNGVAPPELSFGDIPDGAGVSSKLITVRNTAPLDAHVRWCLTIPRPPSKPVPALSLDIVSGAASSDAAQVVLRHFTERAPPFVPPFSIEPAVAIVPAQSTTSFRITCIPRARSEEEGRAERAIGWDDALEGVGAGPRRGLLIADALWVPKDGKPDSILLDQLSKEAGEDVISTLDSPGGSARVRPASAKPGEIQVSRAARQRISRDSLRLGLSVSPVLPYLDLDEETQKDGFKWIRLEAWATQPATHESFRRQVTLTNSFDLALRFALEVDGPFKLEKIHTAAKPVPCTQTELTDTYRSLVSRGLETVSLPPRANIVVDIRFDPKLLAGSLRATASMSRAAQLAGVPEAAGPVLESHFGALNVTFVSGATQQVKIQADYLRPKIVASPCIVNFGIVKCGDTLTKQVRLGNPTSVPAEWALRHVSWPPPKEKVSVDLGSLGIQAAEGLSSLAMDSVVESEDNPRVFAFSKHRGVLQGPTADLETAPRAAALRESGALGQPAILGLRFAPVTPGIVRCRFRVETRAGQPFEFILMGRGTYEEPSAVMRALSASVATE